MVVLAFTLYLLGSLAFCARFMAYRRDADQVTGEPEPVAEAA